MDFGKIYCINLKYRPERWQSAQKEFEKIGLTNVNRFEAIRNIQGFIGCMLSHLAVIERCKGFDRFTILEDDVRFINDPLEILASVEKQLPDDWDMLYLGANPQMPLEKYSENLFRLKGAWCAHAIIFNNPKVAEFILDNRDKVYDMQKIDVFYADVIQEKFNVYTCNPIIATQADGHSDITKRENLYYNLIIDNFKKNT